MWSIIWEPNVAGNLEHDQAKREYVRGHIILALKYFRGDVSTVSFTFSALCCGALRCQAKITNLQHSLVIDKDVGRFKVEVNKPGIVYALEALNVLLA